MLYDELIIENSSDEEQKVIEEKIEEIMNNVIVKVENKVAEMIPQSDENDYETLEKDDFEPFHQERGCSIM